MANIYDQLILHEGKENTVYTDTEDYHTIGVGRNLDTKGLSDGEIIYLLDNDIEEVKRELQRYDWFTKLDKIRKRVLIDMCFNLGLEGLLSFENMIEAIKNDDFEKAGKEMKNSKWYYQVKTRADRLIKMMKTGKDYDD